MNLAAPTREQLRQRRKQLQQRRRNRVLRGVWRVGSTSVVLVGLILGVRQPDWQLRSADQIRVEGNQWLTDEAIREQLSIPLPTYLWHIHPQQLERHLLQASAPPQSLPPDLTSRQIRYSPLKTAYVTRQLLPPQLIVQVEERRPIARSILQGIPGVVDEEGVWLPLDLYADLEVRGVLPDLQILGWEHHTPQEWAQLLQRLSQSSVQIHSVDWQFDQGLALETELGRVHLGQVSKQLEEQLQALDQMRDLRRYSSVSPQEIDHIDLSSPKVPTIQLTPDAVQRRWGPELKQSS